MANEIIKKFNVDKLTDAQENQLTQSEHFIQTQLQNPNDAGAVAIIRGKAGTGKSVILTELFKRL